MKYNGYKGSLLIAANYTDEEVEAARHQPPYRGATWQPVEQPVPLLDFAQEAHEQKEKKARKSEPSQEAEPEQESPAQA